MLPLVKPVTNIPSAQSKNTGSSFVALLTLANVVTGEIKRSHFELCNVGFNPNVQVPEERKLQVAVHYKP